jgi:aryl-alcohol dehydrogenase-like predicted oxidoreductase
MIAPPTTIDAPPLPVRRTTVLGRTGLAVPTIGLGAGGHSRLGLAGGGSSDDAERLVHSALDLGLTLIDTAEAYGTEAVIGNAIRGRRDSVVLSSKKTTRPGPGGPVRAADLAPALDASLTRLGTDHLDIYHLHGVDAESYPQLRDELLPELQRLRAHGKIRFLGLTERFETDPGHRMLVAAIPDDCWDVIMVGFNLLNHSARRSVLPLTWRHGVGVLGMYAVRRAFSQPQRLAEIIAGLVERGRIDRDRIAGRETLAFLLRSGAAHSLTDAAYRYCLDEPGLHVVLSGTGDLRHLQQNIAAIGAGPLPAEDRAQLDRLFAGVDDVSGG